MRVTTLAGLVSVSIMVTFTMPETAERIAANDNLRAAGVLRDGVLTVRLEARAGEWQPDGDGGGLIPIYAFAEEGKPLQVPGPLVRVPEGTEIRATLRNTLSEPLTVHGFSTRGAPAGEAPDTIRIAPGDVREVRYPAGLAGTYFYWATTSGGQLNLRRGRETQLYGAFVIDPPGAPATPRDRVMVMGVWSDSLVNVFDDTTSRSFRMVINGKTWPSTERLGYTVGDTVRWRVINASAAVHPMHLHGFYFRVTSRGSDRSDSVYAAAAAPHLVVTERLAPGRTMAMSWVPERPGNWLFHCHDNVHIRPNPPLPGMAAKASRAQPVHNHATELMGGLVMGIQVRPRAGAADAPSAAARRRLRLVARSAADGTANEPSYGFVLDDGVQRPLLPGPTIVLNRGEPVSITVVNELSEPTAVHWHGIELESYYDGVADFAGQPGRIAPAIAPRDSFEARFTPPRAGTFIYHTHVDEVRQQRAGLSGALLVVDPQRPYDPQTDLVLMITTPRRVSDAGVVLLNGSITPAPLDLRAGTSYRLRIINVHTFRPSMIVQIKRGADLLDWRAVAKDGMDLPAERATKRRATVQMGNGETYDFEFTPSAAGALEIAVTSAVGVPLATMPVRVH